MNFEDMQKAWQSQDAGAKVLIDTNMLLKEVRRNQHQFRTTIFKRDVTEVGVCAVMTVCFLAWGISWGWWSLCLLSFCCLFVGGFFLVDRWRQRRASQFCRPGQSHPGCSPADSPAPAATATRANGAGRSRRVRLLGRSGK